MPSPTPRSLVLSGGRLVTMDAKRRVVDGDVVVEDGKIESVGVGRGRAGTGRVIKVRLEYPPRYPLGRRRLLRAARDDPASVPKSVCT